MAVATDAAAAILAAAKHLPPDQRAAITALLANGNGNGHAPQPPTYVVVDGAMRLPTAQHVGPQWTTRYRMTTHNRDVWDVVTRCNTARGARKENKHGVRTALGSFLASLGATPFRSAGLPHLERWVEEYVVHALCRRCHEQRGEAYAHGTAWTWRPHRQPTAAWGGTHRTCGGTVAPATLDKQLKALSYAYDAYLERTRDFSLDAATLHVATNPVKLFRRTAAYRELLARLSRSHEPGERQEPGVEGTRAIIAEVGSDDLQTLTYCLLLPVTGSRVGEIASLQPDAYVAEAGALTLAPAQVDAMGNVTGGKRVGATGEEKNRVRFLTKEAERLLQEHLHDNARRIERAGSMFTGPQGRPIRVDAIRHVVNGAASRAVDHRTGQPFHVAGRAPMAQKLGPHCWRHLLTNTLRRHLDPVDLAVVRGDNIRHLTMRHFEPVPGTAWSTRRLSQAAYFHRDPEAVREAFLDAASKTGLDRLL